MTGLRSKWLSAVLACGLMILAGCDSGGGGGDESGDSEPRAVDMSGMWRGFAVATVLGVPETVYSTMELMQDGALISGDWDGLPISGSVSSNVLEIVVPSVTRGSLTMHGSGTGVLEDDPTRDFRMMLFSGEMTFSGFGITTHETFDGSFSQTVAAMRGAHATFVEAVIEALTAEARAGTE
ncbi:MAG: hypothetical protein HQ523_13690 [Lentisphaerae bacterium]|nr:hypothetical protein [Lentisphaerota bacterium]